MRGSSKGELKIYGIFGMGGMGKTTLMKHFLCQELKRRNKILLFMPNDFEDLKENIANEVFEERLDIELVPNYIKNEMTKNRNISIFIDELDMLPFNKDMDFVFRFARNFQSKIVYSAKTTADIKKITIRQSTKLFIFKHTEENDLMRLNKINKKLYEEVPKLRKFEAFVINFNREIERKITLKLDLNGLENCLLDKLYKN